MISGDRFIGHYIVKYNFFISHNDLIAIFLIRIEFFSK